MWGKPNLQIQDYTGIVIPGGSGTGKTHIGFEINNFVKHNEVAISNGRYIRFFCMTY